MLSKVRCQMMQINLSKNLRNKQMPDDVVITPKPDLTENDVLAKLNELDTDEPIKEEKDLDIPDIKEDEKKDKKEPKEKKSEEDEEEKLDEDEDDDKDELEDLEETQYLHQVLNFQFL